ncbi:hypothetical protein AQUCO_00201349v1 [Aquilegia coerulea]|uniref:Piwi domain-containing protein n=1 Tax=Aquilegia coerulea TaxID=218851 RepID=A0A2G5F7R7_AQUCA|nr:hypothetical protein AQUCO_00201349v1 [Aquilegia coerulea]
MSQQPAGYFQPGRGRGRGGGGGGGGIQGHNSGGFNRAGDNDRGGAFRGRGDRGGGHMNNYGGGVDVPLNSGNYWNPRNDGRLNYPHPQHGGVGGSGDRGAPRYYPQPQQHGEVGGGDRSVLRYHSQRGGGGDRGVSNSSRGRGRGRGGMTRSVPGLHQANQGSSNQLVPYGGNFDGESSSSQGLSPLEYLRKLRKTMEVENFQYPQVQLKISSSEFPSRPSVGRLGKVCKVSTNYFPICLNPSIQQFYHYNVDIQPAITSKKLNQVVMDELEKLYKETYLGNRLLAYDGQSSFYTARPLPFTSKEFAVSITSDGGATRNYVVGIKLVSTIDLRNDISAQEVIQALDVVLRQTPISKFIPVKRSFHSQKLTCVLGNGLEAWSGFYQSVRPTQNGLSLNVDISAAAFVQNLMVIDFVKDILNIKGAPLTRQLSDAERLKVKRALKGLKVEVTHRQNVRRKYTIFGLTKEPTKELTFPFGDSGEIKSVVQYFHDTYQVNVIYTSLPCLQVGNKATFLPMEVCKIVGGQRYTKRLNETQTANMVNMNNKKPVARETSILEMVEENDYQNDEYAKEFGVMISKSPTSVPARILPSPQLNYHGGDTRPKCGQWNMKNQKMFEGGVVNFWRCLNFAQFVSNGKATGFCKNLASSCIDYGMKFSSHPIDSPYNARPEKVEQALKTIQKEAMTMLEGKELDLLIVILPDNNGSLYGEVKRICETQLGIISQCILARTVERMNVHTLANIVLKINTKVGGINVVLRDPIPMVSDRPTIIFGADVTHPNPGESGSPSIAAVVASQNWPNVTNYIPILSAQLGREEKILDLKRMAKEHFHAFEKNNQRRPERIIFYRDGVSDGQFNQVREYELEAIREAWRNEFKESVVPPITFVVVQKRHHTKLFPWNHDDFSSVDRSGNIYPGTVVDSDICHPTQFNFYLCSHAGIQATSRPAHYHVLCDDNHFTADQLQTLTNNLCYIYARCTRSVSYGNVTSILCSSGCFSCTILL